MRRLIATVLLLAGSLEFGIGERQLFVLERPSAPPPVNESTLQALLASAKIRDVNAVAESSTETANSFIDGDGVKRTFRAGVVLVKRRGGDWERIRVSAGEERSRLAALIHDRAVESAELDIFLTRQFVPSDPETRFQWHHHTLGSSNAWALSTGGSAVVAPSVQIAIVDSPFQMNHPDLARNTVLGWDLIRGRTNDFDPVGYFHSTITAGMAAAVINNGIGVSGMANATLFPINVGDAPSVSTMADAVRWAANHGIRVVNASWDGAFSSALNDAGAYLKERARGMLFMAGVNTVRFLSYPAHPHIYAVAMTDVNEQTRSAYGPHIDFAAPGWDIYSTTTNSTYEADSGTSYSSPVMAGIAAWIMMVNPGLGPEEIESILKQSCIDLGAPGWDERYGWGRIDFGRVASLTFASSPLGRISARPLGGAEALLLPGYTFRLFESETLVPGSWIVVDNAIREERDGQIVLRDPAPFGRKAFYRIEITGPR